MSARRWIGALSMTTVVLMAACASPTEDADSAQGALATAPLTGRCAELHDIADEVARGAAADAYAAEDATGYETCRKAIVGQAANVDEFDEWASTAEKEADALPDPSEAAPTEHNGELVKVSVTDKATDPTHSRVSITGGGVEDPGVPAATGRAGHGTPDGCFNAFSAERLHRSRRYNNAAMPFSTFFLPGIALHVGNVHVASHGCVHLEQSVAQAVYNAYRAGHKVRVCINRPQPD